MTVALSPVARQLFLNPSNGAPASGFKLFTYAAGTTTKLATYIDSTGNTPNTNPVVADSLGELDLWLTANVAYKLVFAYPTDGDPPTNPIWTRDNIEVQESATSPYLNAYSFDTTADLLQAFPSSIVLTDGTVAITSGRNAVGDGGGGQFIYKASDTTSVDNGGTIRVDTDNRRWYLVFTGPVYGPVFGVIPNSGADLSANLVNAIVAANNSTPPSLVSLPIGAYKFTQDIAEAVLTAIGPSAAIRVVGAVPAFISSNTSDPLGIAGETVIDVTSTNYNAATPAWITENYTVFECNGAGTFGSPDTSTTAAAGPYPAGTTVISIASATRVIVGKPLTITLDNGSVLQTAVSAISGTTLSLANAVPVGRSIQTGATVGICNYTIILQQIENIYFHAQTSSALLAVYWSPVHTSIINTTAVGFGWGNFWQKQGGDVRYINHANYNGGWNLAPTGVTTGAVPTYLSGCGINLIPSLDAGLYSGFTTDQRAESVVIDGYYSRPYNDYLNNKWGVFDIQGSTLDTLQFRNFVSAGASYFYNAQAQISGHTEMSSVSGIAAADGKPKTFFFSNSNIQLDLSYLTNVNGTSNPTYMFYDFTPNSHTLVDFSPQNNARFGQVIFGSPRIGLSRYEISSITSPGTDTYLIPNVFPDGAGCQAVISATLTLASNPGFFYSQPFWVSQNKNGASYNNFGAPIAGVGGTAIITQGGQSGTTTAVFSSVAPSGTSLAVSITWGAAIGVQVFELDISLIGGPRASN